MMILGGFTFTSSVMTTHIHFRNKLWFDDAGMLICLEKCDSDLSFCVIFFGVVV